MKISMVVTTIFDSMELAIKTVLRVATVMTQVAAEVRGTMNSLLMTPVHCAQSARPWLNGTVVIEQGPWLVNFSKLVSNTGMSGEQVDEFLTYIRDWVSQTQEYLAENSSRGVATWKALRTHLEKMPNPSDKHEQTVRIDVWLDRP
jgi:hypothetical protein